MQNIIVGNDIIVYHTDSIHPVIYLSIVHAKFICHIFDAGCYKTHQYLIVSQLCSH